MRVSFAILALAVLLAPGASRAADEPKPAVSPEMLKELRSTQELRQQAEADPAAAEKPTVESHLAKGDAQRASGDHPRALWSFLLAHRLDREDPRPISRIAALHLSREPERAEVIFRQLLHEHGEDGLVRTGLGLALIARGQWREAVVELRSAVEQEEGLAAAHNALGVALDHEKQTEAARWHYRRATELQPRSHEPWNNLGVSLLAGGELAEAAVAFVLAQALLEKFGGDSIGHLDAAVERYRAEIAR